MFQTKNLPFFLILALLIWFGSEKVKVQNDKGVEVSYLPQKILFIGNSHTYYNQGLDFHLSKYAASILRPEKPMFEQIAFGGFTLEEHLRSEATMNKIKHGDWDAIVLQENTLRAANERNAALTSIQRFDDHKSLADAHRYLFMTWAYRDKPNMMAAIRQTYEASAAGSTMKIVPAGLAWELVKEDTENEIELYDPDGIHPTLAGTFLTATLFYLAIYDKNPMDNPYTGGLKVETANYLKIKAMKMWEAYSNYP